MLLTFGSAYIWSDHLTSSAVNGLPSCHITPLRRVKVQVSLSLEISHFSARSGCGDQSSALKRTSPLKSDLLTSKFWIWPIGGQGVTLVLTGIFKTPPFLGVLPLPVVACTTTLGVTAGEPEAPLDAVLA